MLNKTAKLKVLLTPSFVVTWRYTGEGCLIYMTMKTITHTEMHRIIELLPDSSGLKYSLIECHAKDILLKNDVEILDYDYLVQNLPIDALLVLNKKGIIEALEWVSVNLQRYLYIGSTLNHLRHSSDILTQDYISANRYLIHADLNYYDILDIEAQQNFIDECLTKLKSDESK